MGEGKPNGWFETYVYDKLESLSEDIKAIHSSPCATVIETDKKVIRLEASAGNNKWVLRVLVFGLFSLLAAFLLK